MNGAACELAPDNGLQVTRNSGAAHAVAGR